MVVGSQAPASSPVQHFIRRIASPLTTLILHRRGPRFILLHELAQGEPSYSNPSLTKETGSKYAHPSRSAAEIDLTDHLTKNVNQRTPLTCFVVEP